MEDGEDLRIPYKEKLRFAVDLTSADKTLRDKLWPIIEAAKKEGKKHTLQAFL